MSYGLKGRRDARYLAIEPRFGAGFKRSSQHVLIGVSVAVR